VVKGTEKGAVATGHETKKLGSETGHGIKNGTHKLTNKIEGKKDTGTDAGAKP